MQTMNSATALMTSQAMNAHQPMLEYDQTPHPFRQALLVGCSSSPLPFLSPLAASQTPAPVQRQALLVGCSSPPLPLPLSLSNQPDTCTRSEAGTVGAAASLLSLSRARAPSHTHTYPPPPPPYSQQSMCRKWHWMRAWIRADHHPTPHNHHAFCRTNCRWSLSVWRMGLDTCLPVLG
jgi:hypothetical protein